MLSQGGVRFWQIAPKVLSVLVGHVCVSVEKTLLEQSKNYNGPLL